MHRIIYYRQLATIFFALARTRPPTSGAGCGRRGRRGCWRQGGDGSEMQLRRANEYVCSRRPWELGAQTLSCVCGFLLLFLSANVVFHNHYLCMLCDCVFPLDARALICAAVCVRESACVPNACGAVYCMCDTFCAIPWRSGSVRTHPTI